jgi:hypothetical protein
VIYGVRLALQDGHQPILKDLAMNVHPRFLTSSGVNFQIPSHLLQDWGKIIMPTGTQPRRTVYQLCSCLLDCFQPITNYDDFHNTFYDIFAGLTLTRLLTETPEPVQLFGMTLVLDFQAIDKIFQELGLTDDVEVPE